MAATVPVESVGAASPLLDAAQQIGMEKADVEEQKNTPAAEPAVGSYERFMNSFGDPRRWAGR